MLLVPRAQGRSRDVTIVAFGLVVGLGTLTRGQALVLLPVAFVWWGAFAASRARESERWQPAVTWAILAALVAAVTLSPWVARNQQQLGSPVIISTNMGPNLWIGHHDGATGRMSIPEPEPPQPDKTGKTQPQIEVAADTLALRKGLAYMFTHPGDELRLSGEKVRAMYESDATALDWNSGYSSGYYASDRVENGLRDLANGFWFGALILSGFGLLVSRGRLFRDVAALPLLVLGWTATHLLFFGDSRFHYPIVFVFALLAARALVVLFDAVRRPEPNLEKGYAAA
jgi:hypothetical protein